MNNDNLNSKEYWDHRFETDWEAMHGREQTRFFARLALEHLPSWFFTLARTQGFTFCDWGCAEGDGTEVLASYFGRDRVCGIDFSVKAVEKARSLYKDLEFLVEDWLIENGSKAFYDVVFSSNTLEHFRRPYDVLNRLLGRAGKCVVLLLPFREFDRHPEHDHTFVPENIPFVPDPNFLLVHAEAIDPKAIVPAYWEGEQILLIYARGMFLREAGFMLSQVSVHDEQQIITGKRIVELEDSLGEREKQINSRTQIIAERDRQINVLNQGLKEREDEIALLNRKMKLLEESLSWRSTKPLRDARQAVKFLKNRVTNAIFREVKDNSLRSKAKMVADMFNDKLVSNPNSTGTIPYEDTLLDAVQTEIVSCYRADNPNVEGYYERVYSKEERLYWFPVLDWIRDLTSVKRVADIGAAYGTLLLYAIKCHHPDYCLAIDAIGIMSRHLIERYNITYLTRDIERSAIDGIGTYDVLLFTETLEHLNFHPVQTLCKLRQMLSGNGQIILTTPDAMEWGRITTYYPSLDAIPRYTGQVVEWIDGHIWQYTREEVEMVIRAAGLEVAKFSYARGVSGRHLCFLLRVSSSSEK